MTGSLNSWLTADDDVGALPNPFKRKGVDVVNCPGVLDAVESVEEHLEECMSDYSSACESLNAICYIYEDIVSTGGMCRKFAAEAQRYVPAMECVPLGYYTELPTRTQYVPALEEMSKGMIAAIVAAGAALIALIYKFVKWLLNKLGFGSGSDNSGGGPSGPSSSPSDIKKAADNAEERSAAAAETIETVDAGLNDLLTLGVVATVPPSDKPTDDIKPAKPVKDGDRITNIDQLISSRESALKKFNKFFNHPIARIAMNEPERLKELNSLLVNFSSRIPQTLQLRLKNIEEIIETDKDATRNPGTTDALIASADIINKTKLYFDLRDLKNPKLTYREISEVTTSADGLDLANLSANEFGLWLTSTFQKVQDDSSVTVVNVAADKMADAAKRILGTGGSVSLVCDALRSMIPVLNDFIASIKELERIANVKSASVVNGDIKNQPGEMNTPVLVKSTQAALRALNREVMDVIHISNAYQGLITVSNTMTKVSSEMYNEAISAYEDMIKLDKDIDEAKKAEAMEKAGTIRKMLKGLKII